MTGTAFGGKLGLAAEVELAREANREGGLVGQGCWSSSVLGEETMRKVACVGMIVVVVLLLTAPPSSAHGRRGYGHGSRVFIGTGFWWGPPYPFWYHPYPYYVYPPVVIREEPPVYIEQPQPAPASAPTESYWYYCQSATAYYPNVQTCPEAWIKVPPRAP